MLRSNASNKENKLQRKLVSMIQQSENLSGFDVKFGGNIRRQGPSLSGLLQSFFIITAWVHNQISK
jgi:hypothetical protein